MDDLRGDGSVLVAGSANVDFVVRADHIPAPGETVLGGDLMVVPGGKGANQAVASSRAGGAATAMVAALGPDQQAMLIERSLAEAGVALHVRRSPRATGAALITVSADGENAIAVASGANGDLTAGDLPPLDGVAWLVLQLETPLTAVEAMAGAARAAGVKVMLNAAPVRALPASLLGIVDLLVVNEDELASIAGGDGTIAQRLARTGATAAVATLGSRGACAWIGGAYLLQSAFSVRAVDTTAAGDTFCGTLAATLATGGSTADALRRAAAAGALAATRPGAQASIPTAAEVDALLATGSESDRAALARYCGIDPA